MATLKGQTIAASYQDLVKRADTYSQTGTNIELMDDSGDVQATGLYLESNATTSNVGIGTASPTKPLHVQSTADTPVLIEHSDGANVYLSLKNNAGEGFIASSTDALHFLTSASANTRMIIDSNSRISLSNNDAGGTGGTDSTSGNTILGYLSGASVASGGLENTFLGHKAGNSISTGDGNTLIGSNCATAWDAEINNTAVGHDAMNGGVNGADSCVAIGKSALAGAVTQDGTVAVGASALGALTTGARNIAIGYQALLVADGAESDNIAIGYQAMDSSNNDSIVRNIAIGSYALDDMATNVGTDNIAIGYNALTDATTGDGTVGVGSYALAGLTSGAGNVAVGYQAGAALTASNYNTLVGHQAGVALPSGAHTNTAIGYQSLTAGNNATTDHNTCVGYASGDVITTGTYNTIIGSGADPSAVGAQNQTVIGYDVTGLADNSVTLGNASVDDVYMSQDKDAVIHGGYHQIANYTDQTSIAAGADADIVTNATYVADDVQEWFFFGYENNMVKYHCTFRGGSDSGSNFDGVFTELSDPFGITMTKTDNGDGTFTVNAANGHGSLTIKIAAVKVWQSVTA
jgi:hypothetical protein